MPPPPRPRLRERDWDVCTIVVSKDVFLGHAWEAPANHNGFGYLLLLSYMFLCWCICVVFIVVVVVVVFLVLAFLVFVVVVVIDGDAVCVCVNACCRRCSCWCGYFCVCCWCCCRFRCVRESFPCWCLFFSPDFGESETECVVQWPKTIVHNMKPQKKQSHHVARVEDKDLSQLCATHPKPTAPRAKATT